MTKTKNLDLSKNAEGSAERALLQQKEFNEQRINSLNDLINSLDTASSLLGKALENTVQDALNEQEALGRVSESATRLRENVDSVSEVNSKVRNALSESRDNANTALSTESEKTAN